MTSANDATPRGTSRKFWLLGLGIIVFAGLYSGAWFFGADRLKKVKIENPAEESSPELEKLARSVNGGVVIAPQDLELGDLIKNLETQLPWLQ